MIDSKIRLWGKLLLALSTIFFFSCFYSFVRISWKMVASVYSWAVRSEKWYETKVVNKDKWCGHCCSLQELQLGLIIPTPAFALSVAFQQWFTPRFVHANERMPYLLIIFYILDIRV